MNAAYTGERLLLTLWVGSLWAVGYLAVPLAFMSMETTLAGEYAGKLFQVVMYLGLGCGIVLLLSKVFMYGLSKIHQHWRVWLLLTMIALSAVFALYIQPEMQQIKLLEWQQDPILAAKFDDLHKLSENLYLGLSLLGLLLVLTTDKPAEQAG
jgi:hypothetical protein